MATDPSLAPEDMLLARLGVDPELGLSSAESARRLATDGPNELQPAAVVPAWRKVLAQFQNPLTYLLLAAAVISVVAWVVDGADGVPIDAIVIAAIVILNAALGLAQESRAEDAVAALSDMTAAASTVLRDGLLASIPSSDLVVGDVLVLGEGDSVGADARLISAATLQIAEASLTGESMPVPKGPGVLPARAALADRSNMVFKGTAVVQGVGRAVVTSTGMATEVGSIAEMLESTTEERTPLEIEVARIARMLGGIVIAIAVVVMLTIIGVSQVSTLSDFAVVLLLGVSLAVAAVPEGLSAVLSVVLAIGVQRLAKRDAVVKTLSSAEALGSTGVICTDKTGTLTRNEMTIQRVVTASGTAEVTGVGYRPEGTVHGDSGVLPEDLGLEVRLALRVGSLANNAQLTLEDGEWRIQGDPTEAAFLVAVRKLEGGADGLDLFDRVAEIPFTSERKMMSTLHHDDANGTASLFSKGAPDVLLGLCTLQQVGDETVPFTEESRREAFAAIDALSSQAFRTLGVAYRAMPQQTPEIDESAEHDLVYVGAVGIIDPPRAEAAEAIAEAQRAGIRVIMITGDHPSTAARIAADLGIIEPDGRAMSGAELDELDDEALRIAARTVSVYARVSPSHKLRLVDSFQSDGHVVAMTGDGVNDAPALKSADIGIAMGISGTEVTKQAARMILANDDFATIVAAVREGRVIFDNIKKFLRYLLSSNMGEVLTVFLGVVLAGVLGIAGADNETVVLPLLATQILWINLVTDSGPALAMGVDPQIDDVMSRPPRGPDSPAIGPPMWRGIVTIGLVMAAVTLLTIDLHLPGGLIEGYETFDVARTAGFTTLVFAQLFNAFNARSQLESAVRGVLTNRWLIGAVVLAAALQVAVVELPVLQAAFGTASMNLGQWATCVGMASLVLVYSELGKLVLRARGRRGKSLEP